MPEGRLPSALPALLERNFGIMHPNGSYAAKVFLDSAMYAGLIDSDGSFIEAGPYQETDMEAEADEQQESADDQARTASDKSEKPKDFPPEVISIELPVPGIKLIAPKTMTQKQKERAILWLDMVAKPWLQFIVEEEQEEGEANYA